MDNHPFWPDYFEVNPTVFDNDYAADWGFDANGDLCHNDTWDAGWIVVDQVVSATLLPDDLIWLRLISCPRGPVDATDGGYTHYKIISVPIYERYAANRVQAVAWNGKRLVPSTRYRWAAQMKFDTYVPPDPEVFSQLAESLMHAFVEGKPHP